jgi:hypothetical protein
LRAGLTSIRQLDETALVTQEGSRLKVWQWRARQKKTSLFNLLIFNDLSAREEKLGSFKSSFTRIFSPVTQTKQNENLKIDP